MQEAVNLQLPSSRELPLFPTLHLRKEPIPSDRMEKGPADGAAVPSLRAVLGKPVSTHLSTLGCFCGGSVWICLLNLRSWWERALWR